MSTTRRNVETSGSEMPSIAVISTVAEHIGIDSIELEEPLYDVIDPDAFDRLFNSSQHEASGGDVTVTFEYCGHTVVVRSDGQVTVD